MLAYAEDANTEEKICDEVSVMKQKRNMDVILIGWNSGIFIFGLFP